MSPLSSTQQNDPSMIAVTLDSPPPSKKKDPPKENSPDNAQSDTNHEATDKKSVKKSRVSPTQQILNVWAIIIFVWALYRHFFGTSLPIWADEFIIKPLIFVFPLYFYIAIRERKHFFHDVWLRKDGLLGDVLYGSFVGLVLFASGAMINYIQHGTLVRPDSAIFSQQDIVPIILSVGLFILISVATSISEEILSRGFLLKRLYEQWGNMYTAILTSSLLYFTLRIPILFTNPDVTGMALLQVMLTDLILSFTVSFLYLQSKSLALPIIIHAFYTLSLYIFLT
jgi:membrane protease YdiL (CAAX protease family)